ncbi:D-alanyl-D-alanine carboxypeptidase [uncultured Caudovirales phage]|uniref:D-alanyl-D-alanine carboxypeptidase n=1 Tax=uncultured Caudovirales phage TaxID=2100421 RepID=A0A6J7XG97_9CAUD|nr:D-alanyl-D-alanine carboxypeptidase [uncultured Caudovirales phage]CAB4164307.1 D-alanyl-D-alanine carboxypeptidase [uncultured Caudovirales phage]CAB4172398.1 D-alanyl-D-alanine carboxypeptidase [uncultured Caudovirales phage]CAB4177764.1 D-alanyl-D-alanine carboxypeptidase [uncultured Caudovirales phage]CAB4184003.1 D-alanyl-D-alanine carboxypeptidase [uncultured Caudovirales phage]
MTLAPRSIKCLEGVHPDIAAVVRRADELGARFHVTCGLRTVEEQTRLYKAGKSRTMKSRHLTGHAVDFVVAEPGGGVSYDHADMAACADIFKRAAKELGIAIEWGGDWKSFVDTPHIELDRRVYKAGGTKTPAPISVSDSPSVPLAPAAPLPQSGTIWGTIAGAGAGVMAYLDQTVAALLEWSAKLTELSPVQSALAGMGGNVKSMTLGLGIGAAVYVVSRRVKAAQEGKPG